MAPLVGVERRDPDQAVNTVLGGEHAVSEPAVDDERRTLDARLFAFLVLDDLDVELMTLRPA